MNKVRIERGLKDKPVPVSTDRFFILDSENGGILREILWSDLVAAIGGGGSGLTQQQVEGLK
jgi:hypothetical protein